MTQHFKIDHRTVGEKAPVFVVAEMSANHGGKFSNAVKILKYAKDSGADAVKLQTYTAETLTLRSSKKWFRVGPGSIWAGRQLYDLYQEAFTPWEWYPRLKKVADTLGLVLFSSPFDATAVDFLEKVGVPCYKIASFEIVDIPLIRRVARTKKPIILSTGLATLEEIQEAVKEAHLNGARNIILLKCTSAYPALPEEMNLRAIPALAEAFHVPVGLSDHTLGISVPVAAVALGACMIEKHFSLSRKISSPDSSFSLVPAEFRAMVESVRTAEKALGQACYVLGKEEKKNRFLRRSLFVVKDMVAGELFTEDNLRSIRPANGLHPRYFEEVLGRRAVSDLLRGTPLSWNLVKGGRGEMPPISAPTDSSVLKKR